MAAPISPQGSRAGLITAVVIFVILFVTATIFAIYSGTQSKRTEELAAQERVKTATIINPAAVASTEVQAYVSLAKKPEAAWDVLSRERTDLSKVIAASNIPTAKAQEAARSALAYANDKLKSAKLSAALPMDLAGAVRAAADAAASTAAERDQAKADAETANKASAQATADRDAMLKDKDAKIAEANDAKDKAVAEIEEWRKSKTGDIGTLQGDADKKVKEFQTAAEKQQTQVQDLTNKLKAIEKERDSLRARLARQRIDPKESIVQQADGHIVRIPSQSTVFIDIGQAQHVTPGLTFEVYDKNKGIPPLGDTQQQGDLPIGKASIEVIHILAGTSECRVVRHAPGQSLTEGDIIVNLVYDPKAKYNFVVYGDFDLSQTGNTNPADIEVVKRLVTQWGGRLQPQVDVDTDFLVMGKEPVVPILSKEDADDVAKVARHDAVQEALDKYLDVKAKAVSLGVPFLNQNRFLYFTGYYDTAKR